MSHIIGGASAIEDALECRWGHQSRFCSPEAIGDARKSACLSRDKLLRNATLTLEHPDWEGSNWETERLFIILCFYIIK